MILEVFFDPKHINKNTHLLVLLGFIYSSLSLFLALIAFREYASIVMVFFTVMAVMPLIYASIKHEESVDIVLTSEREILKEHAKTLKKFMLVFLGIVLSFSFWYAVLPGSITDEVFEAQVNTINRINAPRGTGQITGQVIAERFPIFMHILMNNIVVLVFCLIFSFLFGLGAIFILAWNASVIGAAIGMIFSQGFATASEFTGIIKPISYFQVISYGLLRFALHGIPEILGYFVGGLAGAIICFGVVKHDYKSPKFHKVLYDAMDLVLISILFIFLAAILEVYVTPFLF